MYLPLHSNITTGAADIVGQIVQVDRSANVLDLDPSSPFHFTQLINSPAPPLFLNGQISRFKESLEITDLADSSPPRLAYQYLRILASRLCYALHTPSKELLSMTRDLPFCCSADTMVILHRLRPHHDGRFVPESLLQAWG